ncbi:Fic/DOC family protein [Arthrobacter dokdonensis]|uniref:Fic/DOC family protein n=1 Tax=Arthrobacter dokdonellae TaxID=2211210 RepID=UPI001494B05F|nr:Fic family protein [Arthrobacter dokdonellae]
MASPEDDAWLAYFYPETVNGLGYGVLRNNLGIHDFKELQSAEYELAGERSRQLLEGLVRIPLEPDVSYLRDVHRHLFQDVYPWAGEFRTVNMSKEDSVFASKDLIPSYMRPLMRTVASSSWDHLEHEDFVFLSAFTFAGINHAHPFREGNGRTTKAVLHEISKLSKFELDFDRVGPGEWNAMAQASMPGQGEIMPRHEAALDVFTRVAVPRTTPVPDQWAQAAHQVSQRVVTGTRDGRETTASGTGTTAKPRLKSQIEKLTAEKNASQHSAPRGPETTVQRLAREQGERAAARANRDQHHRGQEL